MSSSERVLRSGGQASTPKPINTTSAGSMPNTLSTLSTLTEQNTTTCGSESGHDSPAPLPHDDEWATNLRRVVFVPSKALATAKNNPKSSSTLRDLTCSPAHVMLFPKTKEEALNMGIRLKCHKDASADTIPPENRRKIPLPRRINGSTQAVDINSGSEGVVDKLWRASYDIANANS